MPESPPAWEGGSGDFTVSSMKYMPGVDGLRAVAVASVLLFHAGFSSLAGGFVGVDVFFVIREPLNN